MCSCCSYISMAPLQPVSSLFSSFQPPTAAVYRFSLSLHPSYFCTLLWSQQIRSPALQKVHTLQPSRMAIHPPSASSSLRLVTFSWTPREDGIACFLWEKVLSPWSSVWLSMKGGPLTINTLPMWTDGPGHVITIIITVMSPNIAGAFTELSSFQTLPISSSSSRRCVMAS